MERRIGSGAVFPVVVLAVAMLMSANGVDAQIYTCWGGCYNECFLRSSKSNPEKLACYYQCASSCIPRTTTADYQDYCQTGCSLIQCRPDGYDGAGLEKCFGRCTNTCKRI